LIDTAVIIVDVFLYILQFSNFSTQQWAWPFTAGV